MVEELLTPNEIQAILKEAQKPDYSNPYLLHLGSKKTSIQSVSKETGLVLVHGNEYTAYKHIIERHCLTSRKPYWNEKGSLDNPTKFKLGLSSRQYLTLASQIYKPENKNEQKNNRPNDFDLYIGLYKDVTELVLEYKLLTYKSTPVIHSFFLSDNRKPFNKQKVLNLRQGWCRVSHDLMNCIQTIEVPYFDRNNVENLKVIIRHIQPKKVERWYIQINSEEGKPIVTTFIKELPCEMRIDMGFQTTKTDFSNVTWVEKIIKLIQEKKYIL